MKIIKQKQSLPVVNFDELIEKKKDSDKSKHGPLLPSTIRCIICGPSNCGKTNLLISLITDSNGLRFENIYVYSKSLYQSKYEFLRKILEQVKGCGYLEYNENEEIIDPSNAKPNSIFIFDDIACSKQNKIQQFFSMGRHKGVDSFYLSQTYARIPKHLIRDNINLLVLFRQDDMNLRHVYDDHVNTDMSFQDFKSMCASCWTDNYGFIVINKDCQNGRYRKTFDSFIQI